VEVKFTPRPTPLVHVSGWYETNPDNYMALVSGAAEALFGSPSSLLQAEIADWAFEQLVPQIPQEVSLPNFLYELREALELIPKLEESMVKTVSGGYLTYSFGWAPFVGDLQRLGRLISTVRSRLEYLKATYGRETRISCMREFDCEADPSFVGGGAVYQRLSFKGIFRCGGYLYHRLEDLDGTIGLLRGLSGALGLNNPLGVVWEAIPFSFVADWFGRVGNVLSHTAVQPFVGPWEIRRVTYSYTWSGEWRSVLGFSGYSPEEWEPHRGRATFYRRGTGLPASASILHSNTLTTQQQMLATALLGASAK
jgi:hypothetical protein